MIFTSLSAYLETEKSQLKKPHKLILSWKIIVTVSLLTETLFERFTSREGEMQILLLKTVKENVCLVRQDGGTWSLVWEGELWLGKSAHVGLRAATASPCWASG